MILFCRSHASRLLLSENPATGERRSRSRGSRLGTTLIELLVVIVIFLIGILAVVQIFPKGFQLLTTTRTNSVAAHLAEDEVERLKEHADQLPQEILAVHYVNGVPVQDPTRNPFDLGPQGDAVSSSGELSLGGTNVGNWLLYSGPNSFRRVISEGSRVPAPRAVGSNYGGLMVLNFGPIDPTPTTANGPSNVFAYANDLAKDLVLPDNLTQAAGENLNVQIASGSDVSSPLYDSSNTLSSSEYFVANPTASNATLLLPTNSSFARTYHLSLAAYIVSGGTTVRVNYPDLQIYSVPVVTQTDAATNYYPLVALPIQTILSSLGQLGSGQTFIGVDFDSIQVAPEFELISNNTTFTSDPLQYKLLDPNIGVLLFNPIAYSAFIEKPGGAREPLQARVDYDVYDWRILRQEFRLDSQKGLNGGNYGQTALALQSIKVGNSGGPDGLPNGGIVPLEGSSSNYAKTQSALDDNFVLIDLQTGGVVYEVDPNSGGQLVTINKSNGLITVNGDGSGNGLVGYLAIPGTTGATEVNLAGRSLRALYRARQEFSVNVIKSAASYALVEPPTSGQSLAEGQVYAANDGSALYFPATDLHEQVVIDTINYTLKDSSGNSSFQILNGVSAVVAVPKTGGLPQIQLVGSNGVIPVPSGYTATINSITGIKGSSLTVQVLWNPNSFNLGSNATTNISLINNWEHGWRRNTNQTTIPALELQ